MPHARVPPPSGPGCGRGEAGRWRACRDGKDFTLHQLRRRGEAGRRRACRDGTRKVLPYINYGNLLPF
jgi:hypothetical protein